MNTQRIILQIVRRHDSKAHKEQDWQDYVSADCPNIQNEQTKTGQDTYEYIEHQHIHSSSKKKKLHGKILTGRPRVQWRMTRKRILKETLRDDVEWIHLAQERGPWRHMSIVNRVMKLWIP
jgi:hypothetical protein